MLLFTDLDRHTSVGVIDEIVVLDGYIMLVKGIVMVDSLVGIIETFLAVGAKHSSYLVISAFDLGGCVGASADWPALVIATDIEGAF